MIERINKYPYCVLLLDEIEKAHPDIFNILLQVMDHGKLSENNGRQANFKNVTLIMTTNAGAEVLTKSPMGFVNAVQIGDERPEITRLFSPEFRNRLDAIISFAPLSPEVVVRVMDKFLLELEGQLQKRNVEATFSDNLRNYLSKKGFDKQMGARPMARLIQATIRRALADALLFGKLVQGGQVHVDIDEDENVRLEFVEEGSLEI